MNAAIKHQALSWRFWCEHQAPALARYPDLSDFRVASCWNCCGQVLQILLKAELDKLGAPKL